MSESLSTTPHSLHKLPNVSAPIRGNESGKKMAIAFRCGLNCIQYQADNAKELTKFLTDKGYETSKKFYMEEFGMSEESWNEWNGIGADEE